MTRLTVFYLLNWLALLVYILNSTIYLSQGNMGIFLFFMASNTPFFLILITKGITKGIAKIFMSDEYTFRYFAVILLGIIYFSTVIDEKILSIYRDHFNLQLFSLLFEPGVMQDMGFQTSDILGLVFRFVGIMVWIVGTLFISNWVHKNKLGAIPKVYVDNIKPGFKVLIYLSILEKLFFSYFHYTDRQHTNQNWNSVPSYTPLRMSKVWTPILNAPTKSEREAAKINGEFENDFLYVHSQLEENLEQVTAKKDDVNVVFLVFESLRSDMNDPEIMPNLHQFSKEWISSQQHFSNSNCTGNGTFGVLTGLTPFYWYPSYKKDLQPSALSIFDRLNYQVDVYTTTELGYSDMDKHIFTDAFDKVYKFTGYGGGLGHPMVKRSNLYKWDEMMVDEFLANFTSKEKDGPSLSYLWFYSTHFNYYFPESFGKFEPYIKRHYQIYEKGLQKESDLVFNRYKNAAHYVDHLIRKIVEKIKASGQWEKTILVVTGDHGEEFNEFGRFAHSYTFKNVQASTVFAMHIPGETESQYKITSHADLMPTILDYMNTSIPYVQFLSGKSLLQYDTSQDYALVQECVNTSRPKKFLIADKDWKMEFRLSGNKIESGLLETIDDEPVSSDSSSHFIDIKKGLLKMAKTNLGHYSDQN